MPRGHGLDNRFRSKDFVKMYSVSLINLALLLAISKFSNGYECNQQATVCETELHIAYELPMMTENGPVYPHGGKLYLYNVNDTTAGEPVQIDNIVTADGWEDSFKLLPLVNRTLPGPSIIVYEGQTVIIHVHNDLFSEAVTIHWHGVNQKETPWMDGTPFITQCPILPGQTFSYKFKASPVGTLWYHSHMGHQRLNGVFGALIIRKNEPITMQEHIMQVFEWNHDYDANTDDLMEEMGGVYQERMELLPPVSVNNIRFTTYYTHSGLINGRGRYWHSENANNGAPLETFNVVSGNQYLFRVIATGALFSWRISVDEHNLTVVGTDNTNIKPVKVQSLIISPGERYNFILEANQPIDNYWIRAETLDKRYQKIAEAILHYEGANLSEPNSSKAMCTSSVSCLVVNCPFPFYPEKENLECVRLTDLRSASNLQTPYSNTGMFKEYFLNFAFPGRNGDEGPASINGRQFLQPTVSAISQPREITEKRCNDEICRVNGICECMNSLTINSGEIIQMIFLNMGQGRIDDHPVHLHGHNFFVLKIGYGDYNQSNGEFIRDSSDIDCRGTGGQGESLCTDATWRNASWLNGNIPDFIQSGAVCKDTVIVPSGGYVVVRFKADIPGIWFLHCHIDMHSNDGMAMVINESFADIPKAPTKFPQCGNFFMDAHDDKTRNDKEESEHEEDFCTTSVFWAVFFVMLAVILVQFVVILYSCRRGKQNTLQMETFKNPAFS